MGISGRLVLFASRASNLVANDTNDAWDVLLRDTCIDYLTDGMLDGYTPTTTRLSVGENGLQGSGASVQPRGNHDAWAGPAIPA